MNNLQKNDVAYSSSLKTEGFLSGRSLTSLKSRIEMMTKEQHIDILRILRKHPDVKLNENKSGVFINLSFLPEETMNGICEYVKYVEDQENALNSMEKQKEVFKNAYF